jgi:hypothetical protein
MITMTNLGGYGRLGNQLFQYAMLKSVSHKLNIELKIPNPKDAHCQGQNCLLNNFTLSCSFLENQDFNKIKHSFHESNSCAFNSRVFEVEDNTNFFGIYLNKNYFIDIPNIIKQDLNFIPEVYDYAKNYILNLKKIVGEDTEIVSVHMRRGDTTDGTNPTLVHYYGLNGFLSEDSIFGSYFTKAKECFKDKKVVYLIFTGGSRVGDINSEDINWCKNNIQGKLYFYSENNSSIQDFAIMSMCDHNIVGHETTFSWWAAYLNKNKNKIVVAPEKWFFSQEERNVVGFYPPEFKLV